jgi:RNA-dependent RNA polymerase
MVCLDVANMISESDVAVYFRKSMRKFIANNHSMDVVRISLNPSSAYLNRQIILILSSLGISDDVFMALQKEMLDRSLALTQEPKKACEALRDLNEFGGNGCHAFLIDFLSKLSKYKEPFTQRLLYAFQAFVINEVRTKAKILVSKSWSLFGVVDETGILEYGQCFVQIHDASRQGDKGEILRGPVGVTRNPCFHPGKHSASTEWLFVSNISFCYQGIFVGLKPWTFQNCTN